MAKEVSRDSIRLMKDSESPLSMKQLRLSEENLVPHSPSVETMEMMPVEQSKSRSKSQITWANKTSPAMTKINLKIVGSKNGADQKKKDIKRTSTDQSDGSSHSRAVDRQELPSSQKLLPYGGKMLTQSGIKYELVDHNQYYRVMQQPVSDYVKDSDIAMQTQPKWRSSTEDRFASTQKRKEIELTKSQISNVEIRYE